ncbi:uncharacterized protein M8220_003640 isoform 2-T2 [Acridotheres tristis]
MRLKINWRWHRAVEEQQPLEALSKSRVCEILSKHLHEQSYINLPAASLKRVSFNLNHTPWDFLISFPFFLAIYLTSQPAAQSPLLSKAQIKFSS